MDRTRQAVEAQLRAMGTAHFELGVFSRAPSAEALLLRLQAGGAGRPLANAQAKRLAREAIRQAAHRPQAPAALEEAAQRIQQASARMRLRVRTAPEIGAGPAVVTETSPGNYQAWIRLAPGPIPGEPPRRLVSQTQADSPIESRPQKGTSRPARRPRNSVAPARSRRYPLGVDIPCSWMTIDLASGSICP